MNILFHACSDAILTRSNSHAVKSAIGAFSTLSWRAGIGHTANRKVDFDLSLKRICVRYSSKKSRGDSSGSQKSTPNMKDDRGFFVVRKGDLIGVYKSLSDCQTQVGSSICDPPVSVYKGYAMPKDTEEYLLSRGLKNALYSVRASDLTADLFGTLVPCPFQQPSSSNGGMPEHMPKKMSQEVMWSEYALQQRSCTLEFDGASKGNPGQAGAGAVLRADDGSFICRLREGLGVATNNAAEYRAIILGLKYAISKGFTNIRVQGDSKLVCMQIQGHWKAKNQNISALYEEAKQLKDRFSSFRIIHVLRESNSDADAQANLAVGLADGQIQEEVDK